LHNAGKQVRCKACQKVWRPDPTDQAQGANGTDTTQLTPASGNTAAGQKSLSAKNSSGMNKPLDDESTWMGTKLGRFTITGVLGKGAMGVVFDAHDPDLNRNIALKILAKQFITDQKRTYRLEQFIREARSAAKLSHPNSVTVHEIGNDKGWFFIAMELVEGGTLLDLVRKRKKRVPIEQVCEVIAQAADALSAAHRVGIVHRDIKPTNLMLTKDGRTKVADFGLAQLAEGEDDFELPTKAVGTPYWMSPEQCKGQTAIPQSDIYSLGAVLYFALTGEVPYKGKTKREILSQHVGAPLPDPRRTRKDVPDSIVRIIHRAMAKNPAERYQDAAEMGRGLRQIGQGLAQAKVAERWYERLATLGTSSSPADDKKGKSWLGILVILILLAAVIGAAGYFYWQAATTKPPARPPTPQVKPPPAPIKVPAVPVYYNKKSKSKLYHAEGCEVLKKVPFGDLGKLPSEKAAKEQGYSPCRLCQKLLKKQQQDARKKALAERNKPAKP